LVLLGPRRLRDAPPLAPGDGVVDQLQEQLALVAALQAELPAEVAELAEVTAGHAGDAAADAEVGLPLAELGELLLEALAAHPAAHQQRVVEPRGPERPPDPERPAELLQAAAEEARLPEDRQLRVLEGQVLEEHL